MGPYEAQRRDQHIVKFIGFSRLKTAVRLKLSKQPLDILSVYTYVGRIVLDLSMQWERPVAETRLPKWRYLSPWMKIQLAHLTLCEGESRAFTMHLHPELIAALEHQERPADYIRRRLTYELKKVVATEPTYFFTLELHTRKGRATKPHLHGAVEIAGCNEDDIKRALLRACGNKIAGRRSVHKAAQLEVPYGRVQKWGKYSAKALRKKSRVGWERRHAISRPLNSAAEELWSFFEDKAAESAAHYTRSASTV